MKRAVGGKREGAGRPKGSIARRLTTIRDLSMKVIKDAKKLPLRVMLQNMERFDDEANALYAKLQDMVDNGAPPKSASRREHLEFFDKVMELMSKMRECRLDAQKCAVDAAPFIHPRLSAVAHQVTQDEIKKPAGDMTSEQKAEYFNQLRLRPASHRPVPIVLDNETGEEVE